jgi:uncharacterized protein
MEKSIENIEFFSQGFRLSGVLHLPAIKNPPLVVGSHGLEGTKDSAKQVVLADILVKNNIAFFRFDHRGCGQSQGTFIHDTSLEKRTQDLVDAINHIQSLKKTDDRIAIFGSSIGGATCINAWETIMKMNARICGAVLCAAPLQSLTIKKIPTQSNGNRPALPLSFFTENLLFDLSDQAAHLSNVQIFHGDADQVVPVINAHNILKLANEPKQLIVHKNGDHQMTSKTDQADFAQRVVAWFLRCFNC